MINDVFTAHDALSIFTLFFLSHVASTLLKFRGGGAHPARLGVLARGDFISTRLLQFKDGTGES